ncbi:MAG: T9SS type A sorting domain-containing protein [Flavobacteriaceae bacterium]|nr:T9SS type A sorting domain-containing protein [Flavobacteriaceae bacterium]
MKTILYILIFNFSALSFAQDPQLFENNWYLQKLILNGQDYFPPHNNEIQNVYLEFSENPYYVLTEACSSIATDIFLIDNDSFQVMRFAIITGECFLQETIDFENRYFNDFFHWQQPHEFNYLIEAGSNNIKMLTLTNQDNHQAIYGNQPLSVSEIENSKFSIHPNPVKNELFLNSNKKSEKLKIKIYNVEGKLLSNQTVELEMQTSINVSQLKSGSYFLSIENENGNRAINKFLKE